MAEVQGINTYDASDLVNPYEICQLGYPAYLGVNANTSVVTGTGALAGGPPLNIVRGVRGFRMPHGTRTEIYQVTRIPSGSTMSTGLTVELLLCMDPLQTNADTSNANVCTFDVTASRLNTSAGGTTMQQTLTTPDDSVFVQNVSIPVQVNTVTLPTGIMASGTTSTASNTVAPYGTYVGGLIVLPIPVPTVKFGTAAIVPGEWCLIRVRRLGDNTADTSPGTIVLVALSCYGY